jgi:Uma2 family endonuclease
MGIPSDEHQLLAQNLANRLAGHLAGQPCKVLLSAQLWTGRDRAPDVMVVCTRTLASNETAHRIPEFIAEILSPNRGDDLGLKFIEYQAMPSIEAYLVIDSTKRWAILFHRNAEGKFQADRDYTEGPISLNSISYTLDLNTLYDEAGIT